MGNPRHESDGPSPAPVDRGDPRPRRPRRLKRQAILDQSAQLFYERGYHETALDGIAAALAVTKPTLYYVRSKEDILVQILSVALAFARATFDAAHREGGDGLARLRIFARRYVEAMTLPPGRCLLTMRATPLAPKTRVQLNASFRQMDSSRAN